MNRRSHGGGSFSPSRLGEILAGLPMVEAYHVAFSGGADSMALLDAMVELGADSASWRLGAVHVHHGLQAQADAFEEHCRRACEDLAVSLRVLRVDARARRGESPEAAARTARYRALASELAPGEAVLTGHHRQDQAETLLLQLLRGAGPRGLAGMPRVAPLGAGLLMRPLLGVSPEALRAYLQGRGVAWVEDPSNRDTALHRNYLRVEILPRLERAWPGSVATLARAAAHQGEAALLMDCLAAADLEASRGQAADSLSCAALAGLHEARARAALGAWLRERELPPPGEAHLRAILGELLTARADAVPVVSWPGGEVRRYRGELFAQGPLPAHESDRVFDWRPPTPLSLPHGRLEVSACTGAGLSVERCGGATLQVRFRRGGERCRPASGLHHRELKKLFQEQGVAPWLRDRVPLIHVDGELAAVVDVCVCEGYQAAEGEPGWLPTWNRQG